MPKRTYEEIRQLEKHKHAVINALNMKGAFVRGGVWFDPSTLTPRTLNRICKFISIGAVLGGGESAKTASRLLDLVGIRYQRLWSNLSGVAVPEAATPDQLQKIRDIVVADHTAHLLTQQDNNRHHYASWDPRTMTINMHNVNLSYLDSVTSTGVTSKTYGGGLTFHAESFCMEALVILAETWADERKAKGAELVRKLKAGEEFLLV